MILTFGTAQIQCHSCLHSIEHVVFELTEHLAVAYTKLSVNIFYT